MTVVKLDQGAREIVQHFLDEDLKAYETSRPDFILGIGGNKSNPEGLLGFDPIDIDELAGVNPYND